MISKKMVDEINEQINKEIYSGYLYLSMAAYATSIGLNGFANWFFVQMKEEMIHSQKFYDYLNQQGGRVALKAIDQPPKDFSNVRDLFQQTLDHERLVTKRINNLIKLAKKENDNATDTFLQWFVTEQVEEEASPTEVLQRLDIVGKDGNGILTIDSQLATRMFVPPPPPAA
tara:strand:+ start:346 stop:861 length:516 start_codon:yes stop_codon:yes gene_type:complete